MHGNLYLMYVQRIPEGYDYDEPIGASNGSIDGPLFSVAIAHTTKDGSPYFYAFRGKRRIEESDDLDELGRRVTEHLKAFITLSKTEEEDLLQIVCIQEDANYTLDSKKWLCNFGGDEIYQGDDSFDKGLVVNVMPVYDTPITDQGDYDPESAEPADKYEFCGLRRPD
jgi:hypothetical protein